MPAVLLVSYWYPPAVGAAARRVLGFARHLPDHDWAVRVLTAGTATPQDGADVLRVSDVGGASIVSFPDYEWPPARRRSRWFGGWAFPDRFIVWRRRAYQTAVQQESQARPDIVWATFPPAGAAALGADLAQSLDVPFVLDMRDLWIGPGGYAPPTPLHAWLHARLERRVASAAAAIIAVSEPMAAYLSERYGKPRERVITIPNGFEPDDCPTAGAGHAPASDGRDARTTRSPRFTLAHVGTVIARNRPDLFFQALVDSPRVARWHDEGMRIRFVGNLSPAVAAQTELAGLIETTGLVPHDQAWRETCAADALLLLVGDYVGRWGHNAKLFEYLRSGRPILCLEETPNSNDHRLLESLARERCVFGSLNGAASVAAGIDAVRALAKAPPAVAQSRTTPSQLNAYRRAAGARRLAEILETVRAQVT